MQDQERGAAFADGRYRVERELGRGGMGIVYLARDTQLDRRVAVKVLPPDLDRQHAERFLREVRVLSSLQHPHIVPLYDAGTTTDGLTWYSMPHVVGGSLRDRLAHGALPPAAAIPILRDVASALDAAHANGIIHRDVKPANILLANDRALLADFGVARGAGLGLDDRTLTATGTAVGSPEYMAPEQLAAIAVDARADQFALACVAYEALSGRRPFAADPSSDAPELGAAIARRFMGTPSPLPAHLALGGADAVFTTALASAPGDRYRSCTAFVDALAEGLERSPPRHRRSRRTRLVVLATALAVGATVWVARAHQERGSSAPVRLLVLPMQNGASPTLDWLAAGLTDELTSQLGRVPRLSVVARASASRLAGDSRPLGELARDVGVAHLLTARMVPDSSPKRVRVTTSLVRATDGTEMWSASALLDLANLGAGEATLSRSVSDGLRDALGVGALPPLLQQTSPEAYELLLAAGDPVAAWAWSDARRRRADSLLQRAVALDPTATEAYARLARVRFPWLWSALSPNAFEAMLDSARRPALRAIRLDSMNASANIAMATVLFADGKLDEARRLLERALGERHEDAAALEMLGGVSTCKREYDAARGYFRRALDADRLNPDHTESIANTEVAGYGNIRAAREVIASTLPLWEDEWRRAYSVHSLLTLRLLSGESLDSVRSAAAAERTRAPLTWAWVATFGSAELEWVLATAEDWRAVEADAQGAGIAPLVSMRRAVAERRWAAARDLAPVVRAALSDPDVAGAGLGSGDRGLMLAFALGVERDTSRALAKIAEVERMGCGRPPVFGLTASIVTHRAMVRVLAGDTSGARRALDSAFAHQAWPTREALRYHPVLAPVLGFSTAPRMTYTPESAIGRRAPPPNVPTLGVLPRPSHGRTRTPP